MGFFLDCNPRYFSVQQRARYSYIFIMALIGGCWVWGTILQHHYSNSTPNLDWADGSAFGRGWGLYIMWQVNWALTYNYAYWLLGSLAQGPADMVRLTSSVRALESAGQCISSGISSTSTPVSGFFTIP